MREIKFRGINAASRCVLEVDFVADIDWIHDEVYFENGTDVATSISDAKLMQYTGLKDKNGVEIYEGDIVYIAGYGLYEAEFPFLELYDAAMENDIGEIKGNIHENPELLD